MSGIQSIPEKMVSLIVVLLCMFYTTQAFISITHAVQSSCKSAFRNLCAIKQTDHKIIRFRKVMQRSPLFAAPERNYMSPTSHDDDIVLDDFDQIVEAIEIFQQIYGDCEIGNKFEVPAEQPWPPALHGLRLGRRLQKLQSSTEFLQNHADKVEALAQVGWDPRSSILSDEFTVLMDSLKLYKSLYGDLRIPSKFVVPNHLPWPRQSRGQKLGVRVAAVRSAGRYVKENPARKAELDAIGFEWRIREPLKQPPEDSEERFDLVVRALQIYKQHVDAFLQVPNKYVVPEDATIWPEELHHFKLGYHCNNIRVYEKMIAGNPERRRLLADLGFSFEKASRSHDANKRFENIYAALVTYKQLYGNVLVPQHFIVPAEEPWPEVSWGIKLGARVTAIRSQSTFVSNSPERRSMLDKLGFSWEMRSEIRKRLGEQEAAEQQLQSDNELLRRPRTSAGDGSTTTGSGSSSSSSFSTRKGAVGAEAADTVLAKLLQDFKTRSQLAGQSTASRVLPGQLRPAQQQHQLQQKQTDAKRSAESVLDHLDMTDLDDLEAKEVADFDEEISRLLGPGGVVNRPAPAAAGRTSTSTTSATSAAARMLDQALEGKATISPRAAAAAERALADDELELDALVRRQEAAKLALPFDPTRLFQPEAYRETAAAFISEYMQGRAMSSDPKVRQVAHFEGQLSPQAFNEMMARPIDPQDIAFMKQTGYRILEFGKQTFEDVLRALQVYRVHHGHINVPQDYAITEKIVHAMRRHSTTSSSSDSRIGYDNDRESDSEEEEEEEADDSVSMQTIGARAAKPLRTKAPSPPSPPPPPPAAATTMPIYDDSLVGLLLGEAVASLRNGDIDGLEDPARRRALDALGFDWGDLSTYQRYRFMPLLLGLRIYKHLFGFPMPQSDFVVPDAPQWPYWMTGMPLGEWASVVRIQQQMVAVHYPERMDMLNALEFLWWIPPGEGVPAKYYEPVQ